LPVPVSASKEAITSGNDENPGASGSDDQTPSDTEEDYKGQ